MIYLDHHATSPVLPEVWDAMRPFAIDAFGNPSSSHAVGRKARQVLEDSRERVAHLLDAFADEVLFTSGATESNNLALFGQAGSAPAHLLGSTIEHPCVVEPLRHLSRHGHAVGWLPVTAAGIVDTATIADRLQRDTRLLCLMLVNHETGAIQPVADVAATHPRVPIHCDAAQAVGKRPVHFHKLGVSTLSVSGHKFGATKGIGLLLVRRGTVLAPMLFGGHQQQGRRPGTEPVALAVGLATALEISTRTCDSADAHVRLMRDAFLNSLPRAILLSPEGASPYVVNVAFPDCRADLLLMKLDLAGVACSTGSACSSGSLLPSPVLQAMGVADDVLRSAMRFSFSPATTLHEVNAAATIINRAVAEMRQWPA